MWLTNGLSSVAFLLLLTSVVGKSYLLNKFGPIVWRMHMAACIFLLLLAALMSVLSRRKGSLLPNALPPVLVFLVMLLWNAVSCLCAESAIDNLIFYSVYAGSVFLLFLIVPIYSSPKAR